MSDKKETRYDYYKKMLLSDKGLSEKDYVDMQPDSNLDYGGKFRHDIKEIKKLLESNGYKLIEKGSPKRYFLEDDVDLNQLLIESKKKSLSKSLFDFLSHIKIGLPDNFLSGLQKKDSSIFDVDELPKVAFEANEFINLEHFPTIYNGIQEKCLKVEFHRISNPKDKFKIVFCPEFLKQYNTLWYVFGVAQDPETGKFLDNDMKQCEEPCVFRIDIQLIDDIEEFKGKFVSSGVDYEDYFADIIGVDNINREVVEVEMLVKNTMVERFMSNLIHESFDVYPNRKSPIEGYSVASMNVKHNKELERKLLSFGSDLIVLSPKKLRDVIRKEYQKINNLYSD